MGVRKLLMLAEMYPACCQQRLLKMALQELRSRQKEESFRIFGVRSQTLRKQRLRLSRLLVGNTHPSKIEVGEAKPVVPLNCLLPGLLRTRTITCLGFDHANVVPSASVFGIYRKGLLEMLCCFVQLVL